MFIDFIRCSGFGVYNIKIATLWGLDTAVYISCLLDYFNEDNIDTYVKVNRNTIKKNTTLTIERQHEIDKRLKNIGLVDFSDDNNIKLNQDLLYQLVEKQEPEQIEDINKFIRKKRTKQDIIKDELKGYIASTNPELRDAYSNWIDAVMSKQGWMSKKAVQLGQTTIDSYSNRNLDVALKILDIAAVNGYRDIQWAINNYEKDSVNNFRKEVKSTEPIKLSTEVF